MTVSRLSLYLRILVELQERRTANISSEGLAWLAGTTAVQVRKDLSIFGSFGKRGRGYAVPVLVERLQRILGLGERWRVALVGAGRIGSALVAYEGFRQQGFEIDAVFDINPSRIGQDWDGVRVRGLEELETVLAEGEYRMAIVAVPALAAQAVVELLVEAGVRAILNFAPMKLKVPKGVTVKNVNVVMEMESLSFALSWGEAGAKPEAGEVGE